MNATAFGPSHPAPSSRPRSRRARPRTTSPGGRPRRAGRPRTSRRSDARPRRELGGEAAGARRSTGGPSPRRTSRDSGAVAVADEAERRPRPRVGARARRMAGPPLDGVRAVEARTARSRRAVASRRRGTVRIVGEGGRRERRRAALEHSHAAGAAAGGAPPLSVEPAHLLHRGAQGVAGQRRVRDEAIAPVADLVAGADRTMVTRSGSMTAKSL